ncbi:MAG: DUF1648 domain-containing protein [Thermoplasmataceae archaeon]
MVIGLVYWIVPYVTQSTIKFGVRIPPERVSDPVIRRMQRIYHGWVALVTIGIFTAFIIIPDLYGVYKIGTYSYIAEITAIYLIYFVVHGKLKKIKEENGWYEGVREAAGFLLPIALQTNRDYVYTILISFSAVIVAATVIMGAILYPDLPALLVTHYARNGIPDGFERKDFIDVFTYPILQLVVTSILFLVSYAIWKSRQEIEVFRPYTSYLQQLKFKKYYRYVIIAISISLNVSLMLVAAMRWGLLNYNYGIALNYFPITAVLLISTPMIYLGQQGSRIKTGFPEQPTGFVNMNDDGLWKGGIFYFNRTDHSFLVAKRFGLGWTLNFGNPVTWVVLWGILMIPIISLLLISH